jgi:hypothetical protein
MSWKVMDVLVRQAQRYNRNFGRNIPAVKPANRTPLPRFSLGCLGACTMLSLVYLACLAWSCERTPCYVQDFRNRASIVCCIDLGASVGKLCCMLLT